MFRPLPFRAPRASRRLGLALMSIAASTLLSATAWATHGDWIDVVSGAAPGTPSTIVLDRAASSPQQTVVEVHIAGFWVEEIQGPDGLTYQQLKFPGMAPIGQVGAPALPAMEAAIGLATSAGAATLTQASPFDMHTYSGFRVWPQELPETEPVDGHPLQFTRDEGIYGQQTSFPSVTGTGSAPRQRMLATIPWAHGRVFPVRWNPATGVLEVPSKVRYTFTHSGSVTTRPPTTKHRIAQCETRLVNWPTVAPYFPINTISYDGDFLFVYESQYADELQPLIDQKKARGFKVALRVIPSAGNTCTSIRDTVEAWYAATPQERDHYCLLVGDVDVLPTCLSPDSSQTDDMYGDADQDGIDDLAEEVYVGRLSVDDEADCASQVERILDYEDHMPLLAQWLDDVTLIAHKEDAPDKYEGCQEEVRTYPYSQAVPTFHTQYGSQVGVDDADVTADINAGRGLVCYRGHGSSSSWSSWNQVPESYTSTLVDGLLNTHTPVVWGIACSNAKLSSTDCFAEHWMEQGANGAVSFYGATQASFTSANHELDKRLFRGVYDEGLVVQSHAIENAEWWVETGYSSDNPWMYLLLGDPEMSIRRSNPMPFSVLVPNQIPACPDCPTTPPFDWIVLDDQNNPVPNAKVSAVQFGSQSSHAAAARNDVQVNRYSDAAGVARLPLPGLAEGVLVYSVTDDAGNSITGSIPVVAPASADMQGAGNAWSLTARPAVTRASTTLAFGSPAARSMTVRLYDVAGRPVRTLAAKTGDSGLLWDGRADDGTTVAAGLYLARMEDGTRTASARVMMVR